METIEYRTMNKAGWGDGPWQAEPDKLQWPDEETGLPCLIIRSGLGHLCGYVGLPPGHPDFGRDYGEVEDAYKCHGGLTYSDRCQEGNERNSICHLAPGEPDAWWLGFDCAHHLDLSPRSVVLRGLIRGERYRDLAYVRAQVAALAQQAQSRAMAFIP